MTTQEAVQTTPQASGSTTPAKEAKDYMMVSVSVPPELHKVLEEQASEQKVSLSVLARRFIAGGVQVDGKPFDITAFERSRRRGRVKYATEEERQSAIRERAATVKALMTRYNKGEIKLSEAEIAQAAASIKPRTAKAEKPAATPASTPAPAGTNR